MRSTDFLLGKTTTGTHHAWFPVNLSAFDGESPRVFESEHLLKNGVFEERVLQPPEGDCVTGLDVLAVLDV